MNLHINKELFDQAVIMASEAMMINPAIIEKDYYVTYLLKELVAQEPDIIFKGGTSLSKCYKLINRFSEDIDLTYDNNKHKMSEAKRRNFSHYVVEKIENCGFELLNQNDIKSRRNFNQYLIAYDSAYSIPSLNPHLIVEIEVSVHSFPSALHDADCFLYQYLKSQNRNDLISEYRLEPFLVKTQSLERTYIDKIFAICDYYLTSSWHGHSRHLYDLHKIHPLIQIDNTFIYLINEVRTIRSNNKMCLSAQPGINVSEIIQTIINNDIYKKDYNEITRDLLFENVKYHEVINTLKSIMNAGIF
jgi:Uncharacterized conserved protein